MISIFKRKKPAEPEKTLVQRVRELEQILADTDAKAKEVCTKLTAETVSVEEQIRSFLAGIGRENDLGNSIFLSKDDPPYSPASRDITYNVINGIGFTGRDIAWWLQGGTPRAEFGKITGMLEGYIQSCRSILESDKVNRDAQLQAIKEMINLTVIGLPYSQSENRDIAILYVSDPDEPNFVRTVVDLRNARHYHAERTNVTVSSSVDDRRGFIKGLKKDAKAHKATVYVVEHLSKRVSGQVKMNYAIRELQQKYDEANPKIVRERREAAAAAARMELVIGTSFIRALIESLRHLPQTNPAQPITKAADGTPIAFAGPDGEVSQEIIDALMKAHDGDDVLPRDVYEKACPLCPGSTVGCDKYQQAKKFYESSSSEEGKGSKPIVH